MELDLENFIPYRLNRVSVALSHRTRDVYRTKHQLTVPEWRTLATIGQFSKITAKAIGLHSDMHKTKVSRAVSALVDRRWVTKEKNCEDRREDFLCLTRQGQHAYEEIIPGLIVFERQLKETLGSRVASDLLISLRTLEKALLGTQKSRGDRRKRASAS